MSKPVLEDRPIWPVAPAETAPEDPVPPDAEAGHEPEDAVQQVRITADSFEGFGSFSG